MHVFKLTTVALLIVLLAACQLNPFGSKREKVDTVSKPIDLDKNVTPIDIKADAENSSSERIDWRNSVSYRQWKNNRDGITTTAAEIDPRFQSKSDQEYQEYLRWLEYQKLKNSKK